MLLLFGQYFVCNALKPNGLQRARPPCPSLSPGVCSNSCPFSWWCYLTISSSASFFCPQCFPASGSFPVSWFFTSGGQSIGTSASASVLSVDIQNWFPLGLTGLISLLSKKLSRVFSNQKSSKALILWCSVFFMVQLSHPYMTTGKTIALTIQTFVTKVMSFGTSLMYYKNTSYNIYSYNIYWFCFSRER